jgi:hypothetical protein
MPACDSGAHFDWLSQVTIIATGGAKSGTFIDGSIQVPSNTFVQIGTTDYWYAQYTFPTAPANGATHTISCNTGSLAVEVYGFGNADGYGYAGTMGF